MDQSSIPINIYIDLSKAFDTLDHSILLRKLKHYGIEDVENSLFRSYLSDRYQYVEYDRVPSATELVSTGVPQWSILRPLLFLIYINDLPLVSDLLDMVMYADDTTLFCKISDQVDETAINTELSKIYNWLSSNKLSLNVAKTKVHGLPTYA